MILSEREYIRRNQISPIPPGKALKIDFVVAAMVGEGKEGDTDVVEVKVQGGWQRLEPRSVALQVVQDEHTAILE